MKEVYMGNVLLFASDYIAVMRKDTFGGTSIEPRCNIFCVPEIHKVIYSPPATIIIWADKTKTVVKCSDGDEYSRTTGLALCIIKKVYGPKKYREILKKHLTE